MWERFGKNLDCMPSTKQDYPSFGVLGRLGVKRMVQLHV